MTSQVNKVYQNLYPEATSNLLGPPLMDEGCRMANNPTRKNTHCYDSTKIASDERLKDFSIGTWNVRSFGGLDHQAGVGFVVNDKLLPNVKHFEAINDRICYLELNCKWYNLVIINGYAPTEDKNEAIKNEFYERLDTVCDLLPNSKVKILLCDFNAKIGQEPIFSPTIGSNSLHLNSNDNGTRLINFAMARDMVVSRTIFPHKNIHKQT
ncbi:hypothetical protein AGLY_006825 [Aphis glycines]|uniref:Endonuclease/exonuclease/phosphatase domain-containing protein n=1 Tax=Aphis glycines TaxID=307491 RepID=A0A6G0TQX6_APHGL|nr:hypothetical protein AGLY_006825 [Aphis glycines]